MNLYIKSQLIQGLFKQEKSKKLSKNKNEKNKNEDENIFQILFNYLGN